MRERASTPAVAVLAAVLAVAGSAAAEAPEPPGEAPGDSVGVEDYLGDLSRRTDDEMALEALSISDAEIDSLIRASEGRAGEPVSAPAPPRAWDLDVELGAVRYNRVEGLNVIPRAVLSFPTPRPLSLSARAGFAWAAEEPTWRGTVRLEPGGPGRPALEVTHARDVFSYGAGGVPGNSLFALTVGRDWADYRLGQGWQVALAAAPRPGTAVELRWSSERHESMRRETDFTLFDEGERFRENPPIDEGVEQRVAATVVTGDRAAGRLAFTANAAFAGNALGGDFDWESVGGEVVARRSLPRGDELKLRLGGTRVTGDPPFQALAFVGGTRILRGYDINELPAREAAHAMLDWTIGTDLTGWIPWVRRLRLQAIPFADAAAIFVLQDRDGRRVEPDGTEWRFSAGVGLQRNVLGLPGGGGQVRLDVARRLDRADDAWTARLGLTVER